jgi:two-component system, OmpR family, sensor histidine kinase KdpD
MSNAEAVAGVKRPRHTMNIPRSPRRADGAAGEEPRHEGLSLSDVNRRRAELWTISVILVTTVTIAVGLISFDRSILPEVLRFEQQSSWIVGVLIAGLALAFLIYVWEKERSLRRVTHLLFEERVHSSTLVHRISEMARLSEVGKAVNSALEQKQVFDTILSSALELLGGSEGSIALLDERRNLQAVAYKDMREGRSERSNTRVGDGVASDVAARREPVLVESTKTNGTPPGSSMCVPLIRNGVVLGVLNVTETGGPRRFKQRDLEALGFFAEHAAVAIGNARLFQAERETVARLEELDRLKSDFVATVSHELRTPLTAIIGAAKTVASRGPHMEADQHETFMNMIQRQADRLLRLVQDVLTASRMEGERPQLRREAIELRDIVDAVVSDLIHTRLGSGRRIEVHADPERPRAWGDQLALEQIVTNLVENALKYSQGEVRVSLSESDIEAVIEVADQGEGISPEELETIFDRFRQVGSSGRAERGFGLGLFIVKNLVDGHNGSIDVDSEVGTGTRFVVRLPKRADDD